MLNAGKGRLTFKLFKMIDVLQSIFIVLKKLTILEDAACIVEKTSVVNMLRCLKVKFRTLYNYK